ncbi:MAG: hypothetical protein B1H08_01680 [Candidatus Omnitrophica bacterium 4484_171]|nr:MAG: hypothetical protein B1H08_01680 [Candidatus Omnitrophica bacterium 4484_171]
MKILFSSCRNPHFVTITEYIESALRKEGEVLFFDDRDFVVPGRIRWDLSRINNNLIRTIDKFKPDIFLEAGGHRILPRTVKKIGERGIKTILWTIDPPRNFEPVIESAPFYDFVFCGGSEAIDILNKHNIKNIYFLPFACDPGYAYPVEVNKEEKEFYRSDVVFVGSYYPNRLEILEKITDFNLGVWGPGWDRISNNSPLKKCIRKAEGVDYKEWRKIYSSSKMALTIHYQDGKTICHQASPRVYEVLACKSFLLSDNQRDVVRLFEPRRYLDIFDNINDLREKLNYYLKSPEKRRAIAECGYREVIKKHTYIHRVKEIFNIARKGENNGKKRLL